MIHGPDRSPTPTWPPSTRRSTPSTPCPDRQITSRPGRARARGPGLGRVRASRTIGRRHAPSRSARLARRASPACDGDDASLVVGRGGHRRRRRRCPAPLPDVEHDRRPSTDDGPRRRRRRRRRTTTTVPSTVELRSTLFDASPPRRHRRWSRSSTTPGGCAIAGARRVDRPPHGAVESRAVDRPSTAARSSTATTRRARPPSSSRTSPAAALRAYDFGEDCERASRAATRPSTLDGGYRVGGTAAAPARHRHRRRRDRRGDHRRRAGPAPRPRRPRRPRRSRSTSMQRVTNRADVRDPSRTLLAGLHDERRRDGRRRHRRRARGTPRCGSSSGRAL